MNTCITPRAPNASLYYDIQIAELLISSRAGRPESV